MPNAPPSAPSSFELSASEPSPPDHSNKTRTAPNNSSPFHVRSAYGFGGVSSPSLPPALTIRKPTSRTARLPPAGTAHPTRGFGFTEREVTYLLDLLLKCLPLCKEEWDFVASDHAIAFPDEQRTVDSLKRKFAKLHRRKVPTGDPRISNDVKRAKHIRYQMTERADLGDGADSADIADDVMPTADDTDSPVSSVNNDEGDTDDREQQNSLTSRPSPQNNTPARRDTATPRPLVARRIAQRKEDDDGINALLKTILIQDQQRREEEIRRRDEDIRRREEERREEKEHRREENEKHREFMQVMITFIAKGSQADTQVRDNRSQG